MIDTTEERARFERWCDKTHDVSRDPFSAWCAAKRDAASRIDTDAAKRDATQNEVSDEQAAG